MQVDFHPPPEIRTQTIIVEMLHRQFQQYSRSLLTLVGLF